MRGGLAFYGSLAVDFIIIFHIGKALKILIENFNVVVSPSSRSAVSRLSSLSSVKSCSRLTSPRVRRHLHQFDFSGVLTQDPTRYQLCSSLTKTLKDSGTLFGDILVLTMASYVLPFPPHRQIGENSRGKSPPAQSPYFHFPKRAQLSSAPGYRQE